MLVAWLCGTGVSEALIVGAVIAAGPWLAARALHNPRHVSLVLGVTAMAMGAALVHFGQGPMQIEMHFYFFVLLALLAVTANPMAIVTAAVSVALHHLLFYLFIPTSVFNYAASVWVVLVHALFVVLESVAAVFVARSFFDNVIGLDRLVQARTAALDQRNTDMQAVLDSADQGFLTLDRLGRVGAERSAAVDRWLGPIAAGEGFTAVLGRCAPDAAA